MNEQETYQERCIGRGEVVYPDGMVVPDYEVRRVIKGLRLKQLAEACENFLLIREATCNPSGRIDDWSLRLVKQVSKEAKGTRYNRVLKTIVKAVQRDERGVTAARLTASRALELMVLFTRFDFITSEQIAGAVRDLLDAKGGKSSRLRCISGSISGTLRVMSDSTSDGGASPAEGEQGER
jgi:hypothetical protein